MNALRLQLLYFMAQLSDSAAQCAVDVREFVVERGSELPVPVFNEGCLPSELCADVGVLSCAVGLVCLLRNIYRLGSRHDGGERG